MTLKKRILLGAAYSVIEPLSLLYLSGLARDEGLERRINLVKNDNYGDFFTSVRDFKPDFVGFSSFTGHHPQLFEALKKLKSDFPKTQIILGGPHATYFPFESSKYSDFVVMSEGFNALRKIIRGEASSGIMPLEKMEQFPMPDREILYRDYPEFAANPIKNIITMTGCPYSCAHCYNGSSPEDISQGLSEDLVDRINKSVTTCGRLFPPNKRGVDEIIAEGKEIIENWPTKMIYFQDDVHGMDIKNWLPLFAERWSNEVGLPYHAQTRFEMVQDERRLDLLKKAGCFGLSLAIEVKDPVIRKEVLNRNTTDKMIINGMKLLTQKGFKTRTFQMIALPYGATSVETPINLDADLELVKFNVELKELYGGPTVAWASTLAPFKKTKLGIYCEKYGHFDHKGDDVPNIFFEKSILRFPKNWVGPSLQYKHDDSDVWLSASDLEKYRNQNAELRRLFNFFTSIPQGHVLAESYLKSDKPFSYERLNKDTKQHLDSLESTLTKDLTERIDYIQTQVNELTQDESELSTLDSLVTYFACIPKGELAMKKFVELGRQSKNGFSPGLLTEVTRHHLYDKILYNLD